MLFIHKSLESRSESIVKRKIQAGCGKRLPQLYFVIVSTVLWNLAGVVQTWGQNPTNLPGQSGEAPPPGPAPVQTPSPNQTAAPSPSGQVPIGGLGLGGRSGDFGFFEIRAFSNLTRVTGVARDRSFLSPGNNNNVDISFLENFSRGMKRFEVVSVGRYTDDVRVDPDRKSTRLNSSHIQKSRMPSSA